MSKWEYREITYEYGSIDEKTGEKDLFGKDKYKKVEGWIVKDTLRKVRYQMGTKLVSVFNDLGSDGFELVDSNQLIMGQKEYGAKDFLQGNSGVGYSQTQKIFFHFKKLIS